MSNPARVVFGSQILWAIAAALILGIVLLALRPNDRTSTRRSLVFLLICIFAEAAAMLFDAFGAGSVAPILFNIAAVGIGLVVIRLCAILFFRAMLPLFSLHPARIVEDLTTSLLFIGWGFLWLRLAGVELTSLVATSAIITAVVAFSMQETLGNVLGGVMLQLDNSIRNGDWVQVDNISGRVVEVRWRYTAVETRNRETVVIPNGWLMKNRFTIIGSREDERLRWRRWVWFNIDAAVGPKRVIETLEHAVLDAEIPYVAPEPRPSAVLMEAGGGSSRYALRYWISDPQADDPTDSAVRAHALAALTRQGIRVRMPMEERHIVQDDSARRTSLNEEETARRLAALSSVYLFKVLSDAERTALIEHLIYAPFLEGSTITRQGAVAHWLYILETGEAEVWVESNGTRSRVNTLSPGSIFGEKGMMTGEPRRATVTAKTDVECYRLDKAGFNNILQARPDIAGEISHLLAEREAELARFLATLNQEHPEAPSREMILKRIRAFFGLKET